MKSTESQKLSQIMLTLANINDNLRRINETVEKLVENRNEIPSTIKHLVVLKTPQENSKKALNNI